MSHFHDFVTGLAPSVPIFGRPVFAGTQLSNFGSHFLRQATERC